MSLRVDRQYNIWTLIRSLLLCWPHQVYSHGGVSEHLVPISVHSVVQFSLFVSQIGKLCFIIYT